MNKSQFKRQIRDVLNKAIPHQAQKFMPAEQQWVYDHFVNVVEEFTDFCGSDTNSLKQKHLLDIGCGDCITDYGMLRLPFASITGLDIVPEEAKMLPALPDRIRKAGLKPPVDVSRFKHVHYDGVDFPFDDKSFDIVFSWSAFEHVADVEGVLREIHRVMRNDGFAFIQVYPWYASRAGSHLTDYIQEPYFHLRWQEADIRHAIERAAEQHPDLKEFILGHLWSEYLNLNKISADDFYEAAKRAGLVARKASIIHFADDISVAPTNYKLSELLVAGVKMMLIKQHL